MALSTIASLNGLYNEIFEDALFVATESNLMLPLVTVFNATGYMARKISEYAQAQVAIKPEGADFANAPEFDKTLLATLTPQVRMAQFLLTDERVQTDPDSARADASRALGLGIAEQIDIDLVSTFADFTTDKGPGAGSSFALAAVAKAVAVLQNRKVRGRKYAVLHPYHWYDVWVELGQPATNQAFLGDVANEAMREYGVMRQVGADWFVSANIAVDALDDAISGVFVREAIAYDEREAPYLEPERDASRKADELNMAVGYAAGVIRNTYGIKLTADASEPS